MTTAKSGFKMLPYRRGGEIDYASLEFNPDRRDGPPDHMDQLNEIDEIMGLFRARFTDFGERPDVFLNRETFICYDPSNLNVRVSPDIYLAFGVDARAITPRRLYLPWEVGKPPDFALEVASESTGREDVNRKSDTYAAIGVLEYWRFDPSGGRYHGAPLSGGLLFDGAYRPADLTTEPDGILKGYSPMLEVSLAWDEGWPRLFDPATGTYLEGWREVWHARLAAESARQAAETRALTAEAEAQLLREQLRRLQSEG